jgi:methionine-gamma-lyase
MNKKETAAQVRPARRNRHGQVEGGRRLKRQTLSIHSERNEKFRMNAVSCPIFQTATFAFDSAEEGAALFAGTKTGYVYTRISNPTVDALQTTIAMLEGGYAALATASGMAAISTLFLTVLAAGDHVVCTDPVYGPTRLLLENELRRFRIASTFVDTSDIRLLRAALRSKTKLLFIETPANPSMAITDIVACAELTKKRRMLLAVDNTFATPCLQNPLALGADVVVHSMTKFINGHSDVVAGIIVPGDAGLYRNLKRVLQTAGATIDPHQAWLVLRGIKTLSLRVKQAQANAMEIARFLAGDPRVDWVRYPGLENHPQHELARRQMRGFGSLLCFGLKGGLPAAKRFLDRVEICTLGVSLGGVETLIQHPASMTHAGVPHAARIDAGITDDLIRLSVGCEAAEDIIADLNQSLKEV